MIDPPDAAAPPPGETLELRYRSVYGAPPPQRIKLAVPGWGGESHPPRDGASAQPWHCQPFVDGSTYGLELLYPYPHECRVHADEGGIRFEGDFTAMTESGLPHPFGVFAGGHYGMATSLDLLPPPGYALRLEPHPRFFTQPHGEVPLAVPGHLQRFWPRHFFAVFRAPMAGTVQVFRPGEPYAQVLLVPASPQYRVEAMDEEEAQDRARQDRQSHDLGFLIAKHIWRSDRGDWFDDRYKQLLRLYRLRGIDAVREHLDAVQALATPRRPPPAE